MDAGKQRRKPCGAALKPASPGASCDQARVSSQFGERWRFWVGNDSPGAADGAGTVRGPWSLSAALARDVTGIGLRGNVADAAGRPGDHRRRRLPLSSPSHSASLSSPSSAPLVSLVAVPLSPPLKYAGHTRPRRPDFFLPRLALPSPSLSPHCLNVAHCPPTNAAAMDLDPKYDDYDFPYTAAEKQDGHPGFLTELQIAQVHQLRMMLEAEGYTERLDTLTMLRFLRARKFDVALSKQMFVECEKWRAETKLDETVPTWDYPEKAELAKYYKQFYHKTDKDGRPIYIETLGGIDLTAMYKITSGERMLTNLAVEYERVADPRLPACSRKAGKLLETCCTIMDLKGVTLTKVPSVYSYVRQASVISQNYYPERLGKLYLINAPWGFSTVWSVVKGWLDPVTVAKINILGSGYQSELLKQVPAENLPKEFGGACECEGGCENSDAGPWHDPQWAKPAKWEKNKDDGKTIENKGSEIEKPAADATEAVPAVEAGDKQTAAA
ncbi:Sec14 cytosolic factor [Purpureocillium lilacinum]|uniref:Sec14 cytosolic factor n=2 Tax=Purpureocillium lilacinum TaxID=33203 RepID=A0A2U3EC19_PURLI|nr:Sec14 cytosolic factor [Purpureocillium lilacinum]